MIGSRILRSTPLSILFAASAAFSPLAAYADAPCSGHQLLTAPRPETSCREIISQIFVSPDKTTHAVVLPADVSLYATPDMESRVVFRASAGDTLTSQDYSSPRGANGRAPSAWSASTNGSVASFTMKRASDRSR